MSTRHVSFRINSEIFERLERRGRQVGRRRPELMNRYIDEGVRMDDHPGMVFRSGPAGRRPALVDGPDVWEVVRVVRNVEATGDQAVDEAARWLGLRRDQVEVALRYYAEYTDEIDAWIARLDEEAARARTIWERRQSALA
ncbi:MAG: hypothetical protein GEV06_06505 [Luteitalea sp.]|nr:hypothetical protein [Luteitalea sp.]